MQRVVKGRSNGAKKRGKLRARNRWELAVGCKEGDSGRGRAESARGRDVW